MSEIYHCIPKLCFREKHMFFGHGKVFRHQLRVTVVGEVPTICLLLPSVIVVPGTLTGTGDVTPGTFTGGWGDGAGAVMVTGPVGWTLSVEPPPYPPTCLIDPEPVEPAACVVVLPEVAFVPDAGCVPVAPVPGVFWPDILVDPLLPLPPEPESSVIV